MLGRLTSILGMTALLALGGAARGESTFTLATMPRIDVHTHLGNDWKTLDQVMELRQAIKKRVDVEMAMWISVARPSHPTWTPCGRYQGRIPVLHQRLHDQGWPAILATGARGVAEARRDGVQVLSRLATWGADRRAANRPALTRWSRLAWWLPRPTWRAPCGTFGRRTSGSPSPSSSGDSSMRGRMCWRGTRAGGQCPHALAVLLRRAVGLPAQHALDVSQLEHRPGHHAQVFPARGGARQPSGVHDRVCRPDPLRDRHGRRLVRPSGADKDFPDVRDRRPAVPGGIFEFLETDKGCPAASTTSGNARLGSAAGRAGEVLFPQCDAGLTRTSRTP